SPDLDGLEQRRAHRPLQRDVSARRLGPRSACETAVRGTIQSTLIRALLTTLPHFSVSAAMYLPNSAGVISIGSAPKAVNCAFILASERTALVSVLSASMMSAGVFAGAPSASHTEAS